MRRFSTSALVDRGELAIGVIASAGISSKSIGFVSAMAAQRFDDLAWRWPQRIIGEAVVEGIAICDGDVFRECVNASFAIPVGCDASSLVGRPVSDVLLVRTGAGRSQARPLTATLADLLARSGERIPVEIIERTYRHPTDTEGRRASVTSAGRLCCAAFRGIERAAIRLASATSDSVHLCRIDRPYHDLEPGSGGDVRPLSFSWPSDDPSTSSSRAPSRRASRGSKRLRVVEATKLGGQVRQ